MLLVEAPWASRVWALPFLSVLAPSERYAARRSKRHKKTTEWAWQLLLVLILQPHFIIQSTAFRPASVVTAACIGLPSSTPL